MRPHSLTALRFPQFCPKFGSRRTQSSGSSLMPLLKAQTPNLLYSDGRKRQQVLMLLCQIRMVQAAHCPWFASGMPKTRATFIQAVDLLPPSSSLARASFCTSVGPMRREKSFGECGTVGQTFLALRSRTARWRPSNNMAVCRELCESVVFCFD